jgi:hypothetical protein
VAVWPRLHTVDELREKSKAGRALVAEMKAAGIFILSGGLDDAAPAFSCMRPAARRCSPTVRSSSPRSTSAARLWAGKIAVVYAGPPSMTPAQTGRPTRGLCLCRPLGTDNLPAKRRCAAYGGTRRWPGRMPHRPTGAAAEREVQAMLRSRPMTPDFDDDDRPDRDEDRWDYRAGDPQWVTVRDRRLWAGRPGFTQRPINREAAP